MHLLPSCTSHLVSLSYSAAVNKAIPVDHLKEYVLFWHAWHMRVSRRRENPALSVTLMFFPLNSTPSLTEGGRGVMRGSQYRALYDSDVSLAHSGSGRSALLFSSLMSNAARETSLYLPLLLHCTVTSYCN